MTDFWAYWDRWEFAETFHPLIVRREVLGEDENGAVKPATQLGRLCAALLARFKAGRPRDPSAAGVDLEVDLLPVLDLVLDAPC